MIKTIRNLATQAFSRNPSRAYHAANWYEDAGRVCSEWDTDFSLSPNTSAGVVAALSPLNTWDLQVRDTPAILEAFQNGRKLPGVGFFSNKDKALRILQGEVTLDVLGGDKVRAFYRNLTGDTSAVCIDRHALAIAAWNGPSIGNRPENKNYARIAFAFRAAGQELGLTPCGIQSLTWCFWRELKAGRDW